MSVRSAVIGAGNMGRHHLRIYNEISTVCAVVDVNEQLGRQSAAQYHCSYYSNVKHMLRTEKPDVVSVVTPTKFHFKVAQECLLSGVPTLLEKPIALNKAQGDKLFSLSQQTKTALMIGHIERFNPAIIRLKKMIDNDELGEIVSILAIRVGISPPKSFEADVILDLGIHDIDIFNFLLSALPKSKKIVRKKIFDQHIADVGNVMLEYENGVTGSVLTNWITPIKMRKLFATGKKGLVELDYIQQKVTVYKKVRKISQMENFENFVSEVDLPVKEVFISRKEPLKEEIKYFIKHRKELHLDNVRYSIEALDIVKK